MEIIMWKVTNNFESNSLFRRATGEEHMIIESYLNQLADSAPHNTELQRDLFEILLKTELSENYSNTITFKHNYSLLFVYSRCGMYSFAVCGGSREANEYNISTFINFCCEKIEGED